MRKGFAVGTTLLFVALSSAMVSADAAPVRGCTVVIFFDVPAKPSAIDAVKTRLRRDSQVSALRFISRAQALEQLRQKSPELVANLQSNPLPARIHVLLKAGVATERFVARYQKMKLRGVDLVRQVVPGRLSCVHM